MVKFVGEEVIIMRLNPDCIKDILLYLENNEQLNNIIDKYLAEERVVKA